MRRIFAMIISMVVTCALSTLATAQDQKADVPAGKITTVTTKVVVTEIVAPQAEGKVEKPADAKTRADGAQAKPATKVDAAKEKEAEEEKMLAPIIQQFLPQLKPLLKSEIHLVDAVCKPSKEQLAKVEKDGDATIHEVAKNIARVQQNMMQGRWGGASTNPDPRALLQVAMIKSVTAHLSPEQKATYQAEVDRRNASRKSTAITNIVAQMDIDLILTPEQRDKISAALASNWNEAWNNSIETFMYGAAYMPNVPAKVTDPILNDAQKKIWRATARGQSIFFGGIGFMNGMVGMDVEAIDMAVEAEKGAVVEEVKQVDEKREEKKKP